MKGYKRLFLVDGDSFIYEALNGMDQIQDEDKVMIFLTQEGLYNKLRDLISDNVNLLMVEPGKEAVDNRIKGFLGNLINRENRGGVFIISHDHGYYKLISKYRVKYKIPEGELDVKKSIQEALETGI